MWLRIAHLGGFLAEDLVYLSNVSRILLLNAHPDKGLSLMKQYAKRVAQINQCAVCNHITCDIFPEKKLHIYVCPSTTVMRTSEVSSSR